jgi:hypothetical protein
MATNGYIDTGIGEMNIAYVQSFATFDEFSKTHPEISIINLKKIYSTCKPETIKIKKEKEPEIKEVVKE